VAAEVAPGVVVDAQHRLDPRGLLATLLNPPADGVDAAAARFHLALADGLSAWAQQAALAHGTRQVCLGGGCFFNRILRTRVQANLEAAGLQVFWPNPQAQGCGDAGLALGQAWVAAQQRVQARTHTFPIQETEPCV
jgi:hydrogenase maturation protein HypF